MLTQDWMMRQIEAMARSIAYLVFKKESTDYLPTGAAEDSAVEELHRRVLEQVNAGDMNAAENLLYEVSDREDLRYLEIAVDVYARLNDLTDAQLKAGGFGRDEIQEGLKELSEQFGISL